MTATAGATRPVARGGFDPFKATWQLLTNVKFALLLVGVAALLGLVGVLLPQMPAEMQGNPAAQAAWLELQREDFGPLTDPMDRMGLFNVFRSWWFNGLWMLIIAAVTVCTVSRIRPTVRNVHRPPKRVPDSYFETAHSRAAFAHEGGADGLEAELRRRHYRVERTAEADGSQHLFAERFAWSQYGTFVSHLALILLLVGGLLTVLTGFDRTLALAETTPGVPVFDDPGPDQVFLRMDDAVRGLDQEGNIVDFRSFLEIRQGDEVVECVTTVNDPCHAFGYKFHQAAFFDDLARFRIEGPDGRLLYDDVLDFNGNLIAVPLVRVTDADGEVVFEQALAQLGLAPGESADRGDDLATSVIAFGDETFPATSAAWRVVDGEMRLLVPVAPGELATMQEGESVKVAGGFEVTFASVASLPTLRVADMPGADPEQGAVVQMGTDTAGEDYLVLTGVDAEPLVFAPGMERETAAGYRYTFEERVAGSGINIKRDPGDTFIWLGVGMALLGLAITFYVPRRRVWAKVDGGETKLAGVAERTTRLGRELRMIGASLGARDALRPEDQPERY